jgi:hypothetical protein
MWSDATSHPRLPLQSCLAILQIAADRLQEIGRRQVVAFVTFLNESGEISRFLSLLALGAALARSGAW